MRNVVVIDPGHGRAGLHGNALRREGECVDVHLLIQDLRRRNRNGGRYREHSDPERSRDGDLQALS